MIFLTIFIFILPTIVSSIREAQSKIFLVTENGTSPSKFIGTIRIVKLSYRRFKITGNLIGLPPGYHGFHIHENYSTNNACIAAGSHLNIFNNTHGGLRSRIRHEGDLGNIFTDRNGRTRINVKVRGLDFNRQVNLLRRTFVIHQDIDDLGLVNNTGSRTTGNSGRRIACGLITPVKVCHSHFTYIWTYITNKIFVLKTKFSEFGYLFSKKQQIIIH